MLVRGAHGFVELFLLLFVDLLALTLELFQLDLHERSGCGIAAHHRVARRGPRKNKSWIIGFATHGVMTGPKAAPANHGNLGDHAVRNGVDHLRASADDAAPFGVFADHESVDVMKKNERDAVLIAVENRSEERRVGKECSERWVSERERKVA